MRKVCVPLTPWRISFIYFGLICVAVFGLGAVGLSSSRILCSSCHGSNAAGSLALSPHAKVKCARCHSLYEKHGFVSDDTCKSCHVKMADIVTHHGVKVSHAKHAGRSISCVVCHSSAMHPDSSEVKIAPTMRICLRCHNSKKAPNMCGACHLVFNPHPGDWIKTHGTEYNRNEENCLICHPKSKQARSCAKCHGIMRAHDVSWISKHGDQQSVLCNRCHADDYCSQCHTNIRPKSHADDWLRIHGKQASNKTLCSTCHTDESCQGCHGMKMPHPTDWITAHKTAAKGNRASCDQCHDWQYCSDCHKNTRPPSHTAKWMTGHGSQALSSDKACIGCHTRKECGKCHAGAQPASHRSGEWKKAHGNAKDDPSCGVCHGKKDICTSCHGGVELPHPKGWIGKHKDGGASLEPGSSCLKCHDRTKYCGRCHPADSS